MSTWNQSLGLASWHEMSEGIYIFKVQLSNYQVKVWFLDKVAKNDDFENFYSLQKSTFMVLG